MHRKHPLLLAFSLLLLIAPLVAFAQGSNVTVLGTVRDTTGAVITGAEVKLEGAAVGFTRSVVTGTDGQYQVLDVPPGTYQFTVTATNFRPAVATVTISADAKQIIDLGLEVGSNQVTITVTTNAEVATKEDSIVGGILDSRRVQDLPQNNRLPYSFVLLQPGAVHAPTAYTNRFTNYGIGSALQDGRALPFTLTGLRDVPAVNGNRPTAGNYSLDGVDNNNQSVAGFNTNISSDAVQELRIATSNYSAEFGRNSGFIANIQTKSGSTEYHGSVFEFFNNDVLNANSFFAGFVQPGTQLFNEDHRDRINRNQFGGTIGGPIVPGSKKFFFFGSVEFVRDRSSLINTVNVPTSAYINSLPLGSPQRALLELFPAPTPTFGFFDGNGDGLPESGVGVAAIKRSINRNMWSFRGDVLPDKEDRITFRWAYDDYKEDSPQGQLPGAGFGYQDFGTKIAARGQNGILEWVHLFGPKVYNDFTVGYNRSELSARQPIGLNAPLILLQCHLTTSANNMNLSIPEIEDLVSGVSLPGLRSDLPGHFTENTYQVRENVSVTIGDHHIKVGGEYRQLLAPSLFDAFANGKFTFLGLAGGANSFATGTPLYTQFLVDPFSGGLPDTYRTFRRNEGFFFIQDDYKVTKNFTLNVGLRYEYYGVISSKRPRGVGNLDSNFFFGGGSSDFFTNVANGSFIPTDMVTGNLHDHLYGKDGNNVAPRIGFAYDFSGKGKTVLRASYGIFYDRVFGRLIENVRFNPPFAAIGLFSGGPINLFNIPLDRTQVLSSTFAPNGFQVDRGLTTPYVQQWFLGLQHDLGGNTVLEVNYIGNTGRSLLVTSDVNRFPGSGLSGRPNPGVARDFLTETTGKSFYHALQVSVNRRLSNGLQANFAYTWSHAMDDVSDPFRSINGGSFLPSEALTGTMEVRNFRADRGSSDFDVRHRAVLNVLYELPFLKGKALGGWQLNSIVTLQSGQPFTIFAADDANGDLIFNDRAVYLGHGIDQAIIEEPKANGLQYLKAGLFIPGSTIGFGNINALGRNVFTGPSFHTVDFALVKNTKFGENVNLQFRAEAFNLFNKVNFMNPNGNVSNPATFNLLTNTYSPRMIQLALRLQF